MRDRQAHRSLARIVTIRSAERTAARHELLVASELKRLADEVRDRAELETQRAAGAWQEHLAGASFAPEFARALADQLIVRTNRGEMAKIEATQRSEECVSRETDWHASDARFRQAENLFDSSRRALAHAREEHALEILADRVTFAWSRG